jgi:thioredoxin-related protein
VLLDPKSAAAHALNVRGIPTTLVIDRQGREVAYLEGSVDWATDPAVATIKALVG